MQSQVRTSSVALAISVVLAGILLSACGQSSALSLADDSCHHVEKSIVLFDASKHAPNESLANRDLSDAYVQLRLALPLAARANSANGQWDALMTTISESSRVKESHLVNALHDQCSVVFSDLSGHSPNLSVPAG